VDVDSRGFELEATGKLSDHLDLMVAYTALKLTGADGEESYPWTPRRTATLALGARLPALPQVRFGLTGRWQSEVSNFDDAVVAEIRQGSYGVLGVSAEWKVNERLSLQVNVDNLTDEKYIGSVYYVGYYGAPLGGSIGLHWNF
jgi:outer-membrane receptor for ferric coprogen and ferric-rhodotorulic acid